MMDQETIKATVKNFILNEFLPGEDPAALTDITALVKTGILDSIALLKAVTFLENQFGITIEPHQAVVENPNTLFRHHAACNNGKSLTGPMLKRCAGLRFR